ncbi:MAG: flagellar hook-associated protein FlgL [Nitrospiraceae bacterium]|nr:flagellar hook-associated protein FlgL [Nitrospiraceae bacterium]
MRVGTFSIYDQLAGYMDQNISNISQIQNELSSGKKFSKTSDDVIGATNAMDYNLELDQDSRYKNGIDNASALLGDASTAVQSTVDALNSAKEIALQGANGATSGTDMAALAQQAYAIRDELLGYANTKTAAGESVFAGFKTRSDAFNGSTYAYQGDNNIINAQVSNSQQLAVNVPGGAAFSYSLSGPVTTTGSDGTAVTYTPTANADGTTTINVQIVNSGANVNESFSFSNFMQLANELGDALNSGDTRKVNALLTPLDDASNQAVSVSADIGARQNRLTTQESANMTDQTNAQALLSDVQDTDLAGATTKLAEYQTILQAVRQSTASIVSNSLLDFLK